MGTGVCLRDLPDLSEGAVIAALQSAVSVVEIPGTVYGTAYGIPYPSEIRMDMFAANILRL